MFELNKRIAEVNTNQDAFKKANDKQLEALNDKIVKSSKMSKSGRTTLSATIE